MMELKISHIVQSPKSTVIGLCVLALAAERGVHFDAAGHLAMTARDWFQVLCGVLTAVVSGLSQDAGTAKRFAAGESEMDLPVRLPEVKAGTGSGSVAG